MDIVLGVSMTPTTVRMVLVEGEKADGLTIDHDVFDVTAIDDAANSSAPDQVISAILGTQQSAQAGGHRLRAIGVTWSDHDEASTLREGLALHGIDDVTLVSDLHAAGALAQAAGRAVGYEKTALLFVEHDTATLSVVETADGSIVKVLTRSLHSADAMAVLTDMVATLQTADMAAGGVFVVGSGVDIVSVKEHLEHLVNIPVSAPDDAGMALARGAALAGAASPRFEATTVGLAYSQDPDAGAAADTYQIPPPFAVTQMRPVDAAAPVDDEQVPDETRRPFLLVGSTLSTIFVIGVVALVISLAVSIRPTADQRPSPGETIVVPSAQAPAPPIIEQQVPAPSVAAPPPAPETIKPPVPVVQEAPQQQAPRQVFVEAAPSPAPAAAVPAPAPEPAAAPPPAPEPVVAPAPAPVIVPPNYVPYNPNYYPRNDWWWFRNHRHDDDPPVVQPPWTPPQQQPPVEVPQAPPTQDPLIPLLPVIQKPVIPDQPVLPPLPILQDPVVQQPRQPVIIQQPQGPSGPSRGPRGGYNPFWPF